MKIDRLMGILTLLLQNDTMTAPALASRFEVSRRTIMRDIETLCQAGIPIVTRQGGGGGISIMEGYKVQKNVLTKEERTWLAAGLQGLDSVSKTPLSKELLLKLAPEQDAAVSPAGCIYIDLASHYKDSLEEKIALLEQAVTKRRTVTFDYYYSKGTVQREVEPLQIEFRWQSWYLLGWCTDRQDFRRFKLGRLWNAAMTETSFVPRDLPADKVHATDAFSDQHTIQILFDKSVRFRLIEEYGPNCYEEQDEGLLSTLEYTNKAYIISWILGYGDLAEVLHPPEIRKELCHILKKATEKYRKT